MALVFTIMSNRRYFNQNTDQRNQGKNRDYQNKNQNLHSKRVENSENPLEDLEADLRVVTSCKWFELGVKACFSKENEIFSFENLTDLREKCKIIYEKTLKKFDAALSKDSEQVWLKKISKSGTITDRIGSLTTRVQMCPVLSLEILKIFLAMSQKKNRTEASAGIEGLKEVLINDVFPKRYHNRGSLKFLNSRDLTPLNGKISIYRALRWHFEDSLKTIFIGT